MDLYEPKISESVAEEIVAKNANIKEEVEPFHIELGVNVPNENHTSDLKADNELKLKTHIISSSEPNNSREKPSKDVLFIPDQKKVISETKKWSIFRGVRSSKVANHQRSSSRNSKKLSGVIEDHNSNKTDHGSDSTTDERYGNDRNERTKLESTFVKDDSHFNKLLRDVPEWYSNELKAHMLSAQVKVLREELQAALEECVEKGNAVTSLEKRLKEVELEKDIISKQNSTTQQLIEKQEKAVQEHISRSDDLMMRCSSLETEMKALKQSEKQAVADKRAAKAKLSRVTEEAEKYKAELSHAEQASKEAREASRRRIEEVSAASQRLEKQRTELMAAFKKQSKLVDNLKRQKMHLEAMKALQLSEEEFMKALGWV